MRIGPFVLDANHDPRHPTLIRNLLALDRPWHVLLSVPSGHVTVRFRDDMPPSWLGMFQPVGSIIVVPTGWREGTRLDTPAIFAHEAGHAVDHTVLSRDDRRTIHQMWGADPDVSWGNRTARHDRRPQEAFANWFAWWCGTWDQTFYGPHDWSDVDTQQAIEEVVMTAAAKVQIFEDVPADSAHAEGIHWAAGRGLVSGFEDGTFRPDVPVTRGQLATILHRQGGGPDG